VLALRALGLGDGLTGVPALRGLRRAFPDHRLVLAAPRGIGDWLAGLRLVDELLPTPDLEDLRARQWTGRHCSPPEVAVDLHGCGPRSQVLLRPFAPASLVSFRCMASGQRDGPRWDPDEHEVDRWCRLVRTLGGDCDRQGLLLPASGPRYRVVVVHPGAASGSRRWPWRRFGQVAAALAGRNWPIVVTGSNEERELCGRVCAAAWGTRDLSGRLDLPGLADLVAHAALVVCGDTGVAHLATAYRTPSVLLFGPTPPWRWGPAVDTDLHRVLWHGPDLRADGRWIGDPHGAAVDPALDRIGVAEVVDAALDLLTARCCPQGRVPST
jgi:ADP-heptose:LPS heptosyltransferase